MDYLSELDTEYQKMKKFELSMSKAMPPTMLGKVAWLADRAYLLYALRLCCRLYSYRGWSRAEQVGMTDADFAGMRVIMEHRKEEILTDRLLTAYSKTVELIQLDAQDPDTPRQFEALLNYLISFRDVIPKADGADLYASLESYTRVASNQRLGKAYPSLTFKLQLQIIDSRYGRDWTPGEPLLLFAIFANVLVAALDNAADFNWAQVPMDLVPPTDRNRDVYEWIECVIAAYSSRLDPEKSPGTIAYVRARSAFHRKDFSEAARQLLLLPEKSLDFFGLARRRLALMIHFELYHCQPTGADPLAHQLLRDPRAVLKKMRANLQDLDNRQGRYTYQIGHYTTFIEGYSALLQLLKLAENYLPESMERSRALAASRKEALMALKDYDFESGFWLRRQLKAVN